MLREEMKAPIARTTIPGAQAAPITEHVDAGNPEQVIIQTAEKGGFDAIVLGTHGRTGRPRSLAGSVAESTVRLSACPVITVREAR